MSEPDDADAAAMRRMLRQAFAAFPTGVTVVTGRLPDGSMIGATVSSFTSISLDPPLLLVSLSRESRGYPAWETIDAFAVNVLSDRQEGLSRQFASPHSDKWQDVAVTSAEVTGAPLLDDTLAWFECRTWARYDGGDHLILVGLISGFRRTTDHGAGPLLFFESRYARLQPVAN